MSKLINRRLILPGIAVLLGLAIGLLPQPGRLQAEDSKAPAFPCLPPLEPKLISQVPSDSLVNDQNSLNCFAWQEFIALNWPASPAGGGEPSKLKPKDFGRPGELGPVVWETFMDIHQIMTADGSKPPPWGTTAKLPDACRELDGYGGRALVRTSKISIEFDVPDDLAEAFPEDSPDWLADRRGNPVLYEILVDEPEYDYIVDNEFYNAERQYARVSSGVHVDLPRGVAGGSLGAIEIKAAWLKLPEVVDEETKQHYKLARAYAHDEQNDSCEEITVALVGLHILHKTTSNPQWIWATFEHVDNAPDQSTVDRGDAKGRYTFYDPDCKEQTVSASCQSVSTSDCQPPSTPVTQTSCVPNTQPAYCLDLGNDKCPAYPIQVTRVTPIPDSGDNLVRQLNKAVHQRIREHAPKSVWQYYQLVGVLWSGSPVDENLPGTEPALTPLSVAGMRPDPVALPLANTTLETYVQRTTCVGCHQGASLAWPAQDSSLTQFASDYSFVLKTANPAPPSDDNH